MRTCDDLRSCPPHQISSLITAAVAVMDADGARHQEEVELINQLSEELLGMPVA
ncbi:mutator MutT protein [Roseibium sp. TrichSKD4]|nr:mutator MutT protein [Roseibium sp. TrichSKD4]